MRKLLLLSIFCAMPAFGGYGYQSIVTVGTVSSATNFTVLVCANITLGTGTSCSTVSALKTTGSGGDVTSSSGYDIVFSSTSCASPTLLHWEVPTYTGSSGAIEAWVLVPSLSTGGTFYMCVGNSAITTFQGGSVGGAWDSSTVAVYHLPNGSSLSVADSSANGNTGTNSGATATTGQIDGGAAFGGSANISTGTTNFPTGSAARTITAWANPTSTSAINSLVGYGNYGTNNAASVLWLNNSGVVGFLGYSNDATGPSYSASSWQFYGVTYASAATSVTFYKGSSSSSSSLGGGVALNTTLGGSLIGGIYGCGGGCDMTGSIDEVRIDSVARSSSWLGNVYSNESAPASFLTFGSVTAVGGKRRAIVVN